VVLVTHEPDIAQYPGEWWHETAGMIFDQPVRKRRSASVDLAATPLEEVLAMIVPILKIAYAHWRETRAVCADMLGIVIGVASVIAMVSLGQGAQ